MEKVIIITGTRKGIGKELAVHYLEKGCRVIGCSREDAGIGHEGYSHYRLDVADEKAVAGMIRDVRKKIRRIDVLINNAGTASMNLIMSTPMESVSRIFSTNFYGSFLMVREAAKVMMKQKRGRIVNFTTVAVPHRLEGEAAYAASKAAVESFTRVAARELAPFGITVNAVGPAPMHTDLVKGVPKEKLEALIERQAVKRAGRFEDVANVVDFFIDEASDFVTGQIIYLGGVCG